ncbi:GGDEF domain-containing protein [Candidatus Daviesbacteria bacterium]|nr:GGDEF domain-containing protein [Candidatus Daviesbacteria bacterium]
MSDGPAELQGLKQPENLIKNPRVKERADQLLKRLSARVPSLTPEQSSEVLEFLEEVAMEEEELEAKNTALQQESDRDPYNPDIYTLQGFHRIMKDKLAELERNNATAVMLALDLDHFKQYNDTAGHTAGNSALSLAGGLMKSAVRPGDVVARVHGDEFVVVLMNEDLETGALVAERVRTAISSMSTLLETSVPFSVSIGMAMIEQELIQTNYDSDEEFITALTALYDKADKAHYQGAKHNGKDKIGAILPDGRVYTAVFHTGPTDQSPVVAFQRV